MTVEQILQFNPMIAKDKPNSIHRNSLCPFCDIEQLDEILDKRDSIILVKNKYPVVSDTFPTVLIETDICNSDFSNYDLPHLYKLMTFAFEKWLEMEKSGAYQSVLFFKNHGPLSGGSIRHPHMQIIGMDSVDYRENLKEEYFIGTEINKTDGVEVNLSTHPMIGFTEFNIIFDDLEVLDEAARSIQSMCHYIVNRFNGGSCQSYNLFFYHWLNKFFVKIVPRYVTTPLYVGYGLRQTYTDTSGMIKDLQERYFYSYKEE
ncbi:ATP adenylyltransferase/5',5'''-P-1,P-4-tetraphosphate phosphorylase II [Pullulanibacillus pueri]|uniref:DUF4931 domain-containing protein n=1 Tax=Pullulanibacillus pueri TaxID=1437324 RepID=A0A8J2ZUS3_9BACL|nr:DUF4931 domain-containing protein [Pullulanibacillus pueri]MBM7680762.1 ATP adenylyltransferase/5',5'''-P-1,P-4-tetraphosphate phosphorylase II [Pullulanibacillus pueri]GGH78235.1 DUF4931 domain-containing protein [Pullulanibacillus pueri]